MELHKLEQLSDKQLIKAYKALNGYQWANVLGEKPASWDRLPNCPPIQRGAFGSIRFRRTKLDIIEPIQNNIAMIIGRRWLKENHDRILSIKEEFFD